RVRHHGLRMSAFGGRGLGAAHGAAPGSMRATRGSPDRKPPPLMDPSRERDGRRILALFKSYRYRLGAVMLLIVVSAGASLLNPFLLRAALDEGIVEHKGSVLTATVLGMIAVAIFTNI